MRGYLSFIAAAAVFAAASSVSAAGQSVALASGNFAYTGDNGPGFWGEISPVCAPTSVRQSPIDIDRVVIDPKLDSLRVISTETATVLTNPGYNLTATPDQKATIEVNRVTYTLDHFHFHTLSEHTVLGQHGVMEIHVVFVDPSQTKLAVIGMIYRIGKQNRFLQKLLAAGLPEKTTSAPTTVEKLNLGQAFTDLGSYYNYPGSLTTPPCGENVNWFVLKQWAELSQDQLDAFRKILGNDFRPVQKKNDRVVKATLRGPF